MSWYLQAASLPHLGMPCVSARICVALLELTRFASLCVVLYIPQSFDGRERAKWHRTQPFYFRQILQAPKTSGWIALASGLQATQQKQILTHIESCLSVCCYFSREIRNEKIRSRWRKIQKQVLSKRAKRMSWPKAIGWTWFLSSLSLVMA